MNPGRGFTPIYKGSADSLKGVDPSMNDRRGLLPVTGVPMVHGMSRMVNKSSHGGYPHLEGLR